MKRANNSTPEIVDEIVNQVIDELFLEEKVKVANLGDDEIAIINTLMKNYIQSKLKEWAVKEEEADLTGPESIINEIWNRLRKTHKLRVVKL